MNENTTTLKRAYNEYEALMKKRNGKAAATALKKFRKARKKLYKALSRRGSITLSVADLSKMEYGKRSSCQVSLPRDLTFEEYLAPVSPETWGFSSKGDESLISALIAEAIASGHKIHFVGDGVHEDDWDLTPNWYTVRGLRFSHS